jgi:hypothetical protein
VPDRSELERRVDELAETYSGEAFADAVRAFSESLSEHERKELGGLLLERARLLEGAVEERYRAQGWRRRILARLEQLGREDSPEPRRPGTR